MGKMARKKGKIKAVKKAPKAKHAQKERQSPVVEVAYEEVSFTCSSCGRNVTMIKMPGLDVSTFLCQRCEKGETGFDEED